MKPYYVGGSGETLEDALTDFGVALANFYEDHNLTSPDGRSLNHTLFQGCTKAGETWLVYAFILGAEVYT